MPPQLTRRQREVLALLAAGRTDAEIAAQLGIRRESVRGHLESLIHRLGLCDRGELVARAAEHERHPDP